jgi:uncharacterized protein YyaL (SSP411 family)
MNENLLAKESSPYLQLHKNNPVNWRNWGPEALAEAESENKPILLSIGYTACHWCHVMNRESFSNPEIAALMNDRFVNIKVDREERPDLDQLYQTAAIHMGHSGGWPLTMVLTPKGEPFFAGGYYPPDDRGGQRGFKSIIEHVDQVWSQQPDHVATINRNVQQSLVALWNRDLRTSFLTGTTLDSATIRIGQRFDIFYGGITGAPKFPSAGLIETMFRGYLRSNSGSLLHLVQTSLDGMSLGGIYDHVGGGYARYATDERWIVPHFEKMLYDNAQLIDILTLVWQNNRHRLYGERVHETVAWLLRDMKVGDAFASSFDAESEGEEGRYYTWTEAEIDAALAGTFSQRFKQMYNVTRDGNFEGRNILHRIGSPPFPQSDADETLLRKQREMLLAVRGKRIAPMRDDKVLADWNGMAIAALARAGGAFRKPEWVTEAVKAFDFIVAALGKGQRLYHSWRNDAVQHMGFADDYAHMARAALALYEATGERRFVERAADWTLVMNTHFWDVQNGGYFYTADDDEPLIVRSRTAIDQATPSANGTMVHVLGKLFLITGDDTYRDRTNALLQAFSDDVPNRYLAMATYLNGLETVTSGLQIVIVGPRDNAKTQELIAAVEGRSLPMRALVVIGPDDKLAETHPAFGKTMLNGQPTAYVCQRQNCSPPVTSAVTLSQMLQLPPRPAAGQA